MKIEETSAATKSEKERVSKVLDLIATHPASTPDERLRATAQLNGRQMHTERLDASHRR